MTGSKAGVGCVALAIGIVILLAVGLGMDVVLALGIHYLFPAVTVGKAFIGCVMLGVLLAWIASAFRK